MKDMGSVACEMSELKKRYDFLEHHREELIVIKNNTGKELDDCQKGNK